MAMMAYTINPTLAYTVSLLATLSWDYIFYEVFFLRKDLSWRWIEKKAFEKSSREKMKGKRDKVKCIIDLNIFVLVVADYSHNSKSLTNMVWYNQDVYEVGNRPSRQRGGLKV
jgi:hypothetical protein